MARLSNIIDGNKLISYEKWCNHIDSLKSAAVINDEEKAVKQLLPLFEGAVKKRIPSERFGLLFSGGVDSAFIAYICKKTTSNFVCYTVGIEGAKDVVAAKEVAKEIGLEHNTRTHTLKEMETLFENTAKILGTDLVNIVNLGVGAVEVAAMQMAKKDKISVMFSGLGSEEIFAGYQRHEKAENTNKECWLGLKSMWERDFKREFKIADYEKMTTLTPFLDRELIKTAMQIDGALKIKGDIKKYILRKTAAYAGLPKKFAFRPKVAAQYGSNFDKAISKICKTKGYKFKKEYLDYLTSKLR